MKAVLNSWYFSLRNNALNCHCDFLDRDVASVNVGETERHKDFSDVIKECTISLNFCIAQHFCTFKYSFITHLRTSTKKKRKVWFKKFRIAMNNSNASVHCDVVCRCRRNVAITDDRVCFQQLTYLN